MESIFAGLAGDPMLALAVAIAYFGMRIFVAYFGRDRDKHDDDDDDFGTPLSELAKG